MWVFVVHAIAVVVLARHWGVSSQLLLRSVRGPLVARYCV